MHRADERVSAVLWHFAVEYYASAQHPLFDATGFPAGMFETVRDWLAAHELPA